MPAPRFYINWWGSSGGGGGGGSGTVTTVSVTTANGVSGTVTNPTTTPAITLTLGDITPTSVVTINGAVGTKVDVFKLSTGGGTNTELLRIDGGLTTASEFTIKVLNTGTGVSRALSIYGGNGLWLESQSGNLTLNAASSLVLRASSATRFNLTSSALAPQSDNAMDLGGSGLQIRSLYLATSAILASACTINWNADTFLVRNAPNTLAGRNSTTAQRWMVFNTFTDTSNGEWLDLDWTTSANKLRFGTNKNGTGSTRLLEFIVGGTAAMQFDSGGNSYPATNNGQSSGISSNRWNSVWAQTKVQIGASGADVILTGEASGILQLGQDAGTPVAQRIKAFDGSGSNIAGSDLEVGGGQGSGTGVGGSFIVKGAPAGSSGSSLNAYQNNFIVTAAGDIRTQKTVTAGGTTGAQTINKPSGSVNFAAAATSLVVTNSLVTTSSIIVATVATNDSTMKSVIAVAAAGSFTLFANAAATAETRVNFHVLN